MKYKHIYVCRFQLDKITSTSLFETYICLHIIFSIYCCIYTMHYFANKTVVRPIFEDIRNQINIELCTRTNCQNFSRYFFMIHYVHNTGIYNVIVSILWAMSLNLASQRDPSYPELVSSRIYHDCKLMSCHHCLHAFVIPC